MNGNPLSRLPVFVFAVFRAFVLHLPLGLECSRNFLVRYLYFIARIEAFGQNLQLAAGGACLPCQRIAVTLFIVPRPEGNLGFGDTVIARIGPEDRDDVLIMVIAAYAEIRRVSISQINTVIEQVARISTRTTT